MGVGRRFMALCLSVLLLGMMHVTAYAHDVPDTSKKGTISISMMYEDKEVPGGTLTLYQVGEIEEDDGNYSFILNSDFKDSGANLTELSDPELAEKASIYGALTLYLDFINIFLYVVRLLGMNSRRRN